MSDELDRLEERVNLLLILVEDLKDEKAKYEDALKKIDERGSTAGGQWSSLIAERALEGSEF